MSDLDKQLTTDVAGSGETSAPVADVSDANEIKAPETEQEYRDFLASVGVSVRKNASMDALLAAYEEYQASQVVNDSAQDHEQQDLAGLDASSTEQESDHENGDAQEQLESGADDTNLVGQDDEALSFPVKGTVHNKTISDRAFPELGKQPARFIPSGGFAEVVFANRDQLDKFLLNAEKMRVLNGWKNGVGIILELEGA